MKEKILMVVFVLVLGSVLTTALIAVDEYTAPFIEKNAETKIKSSILKALEISFQAESAEMGELFDKNISIEQKVEMTFYVSEQGDIAFRFTGSGLWGPISGVLALRPDFKTIKAITIIHQEETPGLGSRIAEEAYLQGFRNKIFAPILRLVQAGRGGGGDSEVDVIAGATMSSDAFINILTSQFEQYAEAYRGGAK